MNQSVLNYANRDYFNNLIMGSVHQMAAYLPKEVDIALPDESGEQDYISVPMTVDSTMREQFVRDYVSELDLFGDNLLGKPLSEVFEGCVKTEDEAVLENVPEMNERIKGICELIWNRAFHEIMYEKYPAITSAAQLNFTEQLYTRAYDEYYNDRSNNGYTQADEDRLCDGER